MHFPAGLAVDTPGKSCKISPGFTAASEALGERGILLFEMLNDNHYKHINRKGLL